MEMKNLRNWARACYLFLKVEYSWRLCGLDACLFMASCLIIHFNNSGGWAGRGHVVHLLAALFNLYFDADAGWGS